MKTELRSPQGYLSVYLNIENGEIQISTNLSDGKNGQAVYEHLKLALDFSGKVICLESEMDGPNSRSITVKFDSIFALVNYLKHQGLNMAQIKIMEI